MSDTSGSARADGVRERLIHAAISLLADQGPAALKARTVASAAGLSTMAVYSHFGGIPELKCAAIDYRFRDLASAFSRLPVTDDPIADLVVQALTCRRVARENPYLYDLMFGLSTLATHRRVNHPGIRLSGSSPAFQRAYAYFAAACTRLVNSGRVRQQNPGAVAAQLWSLLHGFITHELGEAFLACDDPAIQVLLPMGVNLSVGLGDTRERAEASHCRAARLYESITGETRAAR